MSHGRGVLLLTTRWACAYPGGYLLASKRSITGSTHMSKSTDVIQGTLDMLILKSLSLEPMHGFGITQRIEQISRGVFRVNPGSLLLAFRRMERAGLIEAEWRSSENNRRARYYAITAKGRKRLEVETSDWARRAAAIARLLEA